MPDQYRLVRGHREPVSAPVLDAAQRRVVDHPGGPLLVLAGPGTGKTTTLVETAVARVEAGRPIDELLLLTFSRRAAGELRDRVTARLGGTLREPIARTLHSYAFGVLRLANLRSGRDAPLLLSSAEQDIVLRELLAETNPEHWPVELRPALHTHAFAAELRDLLMRAVERGLDGRELARIGEVRNRPDWAAAGRFFTEYSQVTALKHAARYDPAELINAVLNAFDADPDLLAAERARRRRILVDEYQDTDPAQAELLERIAGGADELILVGDPDQSIYAFRGADESALRLVDERFGNGAQVPVVALTSSRRSGPDLLAATRRVAARLPGRADHRSLAAADPDAPGSVRVELFRTASEEASSIAATLRHAHLTGTPWSRMAVIVRSTAGTLATLRRALVTAGVPVGVRGEDLPLAEQPAVSVLLDAVRFVADPSRLTEDAAEQLLLGAIGRGDVVQLRRLRRALREQVGPDEPVALVPAVLDPLAAGILPDHVRRPVQRVAAVLAAGRAVVDAERSAEDVLWAVWQASRLSERWAQASAGGGPSGAAADRDLDAVVELFDTAARFTDRLPAAGVPLLADHVEAQQVPGDARTGGPLTDDAVHVLTAHASKGLEWDVVCVAHVQEGSWPDLRRRGSLLGAELLVDLLAGRDGGLRATATQLAEERRLFYVAATRARRALVVTAVLGEEEQPSRFLDELDPVDGERPLSRVRRGVHLAGLVAELRAAVCDPDRPEDVRASAAAELARLADAGVRGADPASWWGLAELSDDGPVADPSRPVPVSPSRIETYLTCELRAVFKELGVTDGDTISASLGTLVHEVAASAPPDATLADLEAALDEQWAGLEFGARWFSANERVRAGRILEKLVDWLHASRAKLELVAIEEGFSARVGDAVLTGRVDRLERDGDGKLVVADLKTGKSKVPAKDVAQHPQLGAYQLAVEAGAFGAGEHSGGAMLVQLAAGGSPEQVQDPLAQAEDPDWIANAVAHVATRLRGHEFTAKQNQRCQNCEYAPCCPLQTAGRQVTT